MRTWIKTLAILFCLLLALPALADDDVVVVGAGAAAGCSASVDYVGGKDTSSSVLGVANRVYIQLHTPSCTSGGCSSGNLVTAWISNMEADTDVVKICIWTDDGDDTPDEGDTLLYCTSAITGTAVQWYSQAVVGTIALSCATKYWIGIVTDSNQWKYGYGSSGTMYYQGIAGSYDDPATKVPNLGGSWTSVADRNYAVYFTIGP